MLRASMGVICFSLRWGLVIGVFAVTISSMEAHASLTETKGKIAIALVTFGPGEEPWQRFGHNALWVRDLGSGINTLYNYGRFSFEEKNFIFRFIQGRMRYWLEKQDPELTFSAYKIMGRAVYVQELRLTNEQQVRLRNFLEWNSHPDNSFYDYNYYTDNCSTRLRDAVDQVLGGKIFEQTHDIQASTSFRFHTQSLTSQTPWLYTGLLLALGSPVDKAISVWEDMFIPMRLREHIRTIMVLDKEGSLVSLVNSEKTLFASKAVFQEASIYTKFHTYLLFGLLLGGVFVWLGMLSSERPLVKFSGVAVIMCWLLVIGIGGSILSALWIFTDHLYSFYNENLFFLTPLALPLALLFLVTLYSKKNMAYLSFILCCVMVGLSLIGFLIQVFPNFDQVNASIVACFLPANLGVCFAVFRKISPFLRNSIEKT